MTSTAFSSSVRTVYIHNGPRGPQGLPGDTGPQGPQGPGVNVLGNWVNGTTYGPLDAVTYRSSLMDGVDSLYIQKSSEASSVSTTPPHEDPSRWEEIGSVSFGNAFGGIWEVYQFNHGFEYVGTPVAFDFATQTYISADADATGDLGIAVVREVIDDDRVILQSTGSVPYIDSRVIYPDGSSWTQGVIYYVSTVRGRLQETPPDETLARINPILMAADSPSPGAMNGIALPWQPQEAGPTPQRVLVGFDKYYYDAAGGEMSFSGADRNGNVLSYTAGDASNEVFVQGLNLDETAFTMPDGVTVGLTAPAQAGDVIEVWVPAQPLTTVIPSTLAKLDNIEGSFNSATKVFPLAVGGVPVATASATNAMVTLDMFLQEPEVDYTIIPTPGDELYSSISFSEPPPAGTRFTGLLFREAADVVALPEVDWLHVAVDAATGTRFPENPIDETYAPVDPFDSLSSAFAWVVENYSAVGFLYVEVEAGTYDEYGSGRWDPSSDWGDLMIPANVLATELSFVDGTPANTIVNATGILYARNGTKLMLSGGVTLNVAGVLGYKGFVNYGDVIANLSSTFGSPFLVKNGQFFVDSGGSLVINSGITGTVLELENVYTKGLSLGDITVNLSAGVDNQNTITCRGGSVFLRGSVTITGAGASSGRVQYDWGAIGEVTGTLTGATVEKISRAGAMLKDIP